MTKEQSRSRRGVDPSKNQKIVSGELTDQDMKAISGGMRKAGGDQTKSGTEFLRYIFGTVF